MRNGLHGGWIADLLFLVSVAVADMAAGQRMLAEFGGAGTAFAPWWNAFGFAVPGLLIAGFALALETPMRRAGARHGGRIGSTLLMLSGLFFAAQGALPYDPRAPDERASQLHVVALSLSLIAFLPATVCIAASLRKVPAWWLLRWLGTLFAGMVLLGMLLPPSALPTPLQNDSALLQRMLLAAYFGWIGLLSVIALRAE